MTNAQNHSTKTCNTQSGARGNRRYSRNAVSQKYRRQGTPKRVKPNLRQILIDSRALRGTQLTGDEMQQLIAVIGPALKRSSAGRPFNTESFWALHHWGRHVTNEDLDALEAILRAIRARLDPILHAGHQRVTDEHYCVSTMLADLGEERHWRQADPTRAPVEQRSRLSIAAIDHWFAGTAFDAGMVV